MTENSDLLENVTTKPVNGILKSEGLSKQMPETKRQRRPS